MKFRSMIKSSLFVFAILGSGAMTCWGLEKKPLGVGSVLMVKNNVQETDGSENKKATKDGEIRQGHKVETGAGSCTEISFTDSSVMRVDQNSHFSFDSKERAIKLDQGTLLMHVPPGNGGISIEGGGVVGVVSGSTVMASNDGKGNFAFVVLETEGGAGQIINKDGTVMPLSPGLMGVVSANRPGVAKSFEVNLTGLMESSPLYTEFGTRLAGSDKVTTVAEQQGQSIESGVKVLDLAPSADNQGSRTDDPVVQAFVTLTGLSKEDCAQAPNLALYPAKAGEGKIPDVQTAFTMNTDAGGDVSARVASGSAVFVPNGSSTGMQIGSNQGFSSGTGKVASLGLSDSFTGKTSIAGDARSPEGKSVAASSMPPSEGGGNAPADVATAAGSESTAAGTETAAGGNNNPANTQAPAPPPVNSNPNSGNATPV